MCTQAETNTTHTLSSRLPCSSPGPCRLPPLYRLPPTYHLPSSCTEAHRAQICLPLPNSWSHHVMTTSQVVFIPNVQRSTSGILYSESLKFCPFFTCKYFVRYDIAIPGLGAFFCLYPLPLSYGNFLGFHCKSTSCTVKYLLTICRSFLHGLHAHKKLKTFSITFTNYVWNAKGWKWNPSPICRN